MQNGHTPGVAVLSGADRLAFSLLMFAWLRKTANFQIEILVVFVCVYAAFFVAEHHLVHVSGAQTWAKSDHVLPYSEHFRSRQTLRYTQS